MNLLIIFKINLILILTIYAGSISTDQDLSNKQDYTDTIAPQIFPIDGTKFQIIPVNTLNNFNGAKEIVSVTNSGKLQKILSTPEVKVYKVQNMIVDELPIEFPNDLQNDLKNQVENVQAIDLSHSEIELEERFRHPIQSSRNTMVDDIDIEVHSKPKTTIHFPILCGTILTVVIAGVFIGYLYWGYYTKKLYGNRQKLLSHDNFNEHSTECI